MLDHFLDDRYIRTLTLLVLICVLVWKLAVKSQNCTFVVTDVNLVYVLMIFVKNAE